MADQTPYEKLQPCLLDRLTDDEPTKQEESRQQRIVSEKKYREGVKRDLEWLFNSSAYLTVEGMESFQLKDYPEAYRSVINFGVRQLFGIASLDTEQFQAELAEALRVFEPRISPRGLALHTDVNRNFVTFEVEGNLWVNARPEHLHLKSVLDIETGECLLGDAPHGRTAP